MNNYTVKWGNGHESRHETYEAARAAVLESYPEAEIGHDGDLTDGGRRTLCWETAGDSLDDDDGRLAVCSIWRDRDAAHLAPAERELDARDVRDGFPGRNQ